MFNKYFSCCGSKEHTAKNSIYRPTVEAKNASLSSASIQTGPGENSPRIQSTTEILLPTNERGNSLYWKVDTVKTITTYPSSTSEKNISFCEKLEKLLENLPKSAEGNIQSEFHEIKEERESRIINIHLEYKQAPEDPAARQQFIESRWHT